MMDASVVLSSIMGMISPAQIIFYMLAACILLSSLMVVASRNAVSSAVFLVVDLFFISAMYASMDAHFAAAIQVLVYAGAIVVLFVFVIMLLNLKPEAMKGIHLNFPEAAVLVFTFIGFCVIAIAVSRTGATGIGDGNMTAAAITAAGGNTYVVAMRMFTGYLWPFELASFLILLAIVASVVIAKKEPKIAGKKMDGDASLARDVASSTSAGH